MTDGMVLPIAFWDHYPKCSMKLVLREMEGTIDLLFSICLLIWLNLLPVACEDKIFLKRAHTVCPYDEQGSVHYIFNITCHPERKNAKRFEVEVLRRRSKTEERSDEGGS